MAVPPVTARKLETASRLKASGFRAICRHPLTAGIQLINSSPIVSQREESPARLPESKWTGGSSSPSHHLQPGYEQPRRGHLGGARLQTPRIEDNLIAANGSGQARRCRSPVSRCSSAARPPPRKTTVLWTTPRTPSGSTTALCPRPISPISSARKCPFSRQADGGFDRQIRPEKGVPYQKSMDPKLFGRYQITRKLAGGGMGRVFLAYDPVLNRQVGLKLIDAGGDRDSLDVIAAERRGATLQDQLAKREDRACRPDFRCGRARRLFLHRHGIYRRRGFMGIDGARAAPAPYRAVSSPSISSTSWQKLTPFRRLSKTALIAALFTAISSRAMSALRPPAR